MAVYEITVTVCTPESDAYYVQVGQAMGEEIMDYAESRVRDRLWPRGSTVSVCTREQPSDAEWRREEIQPPGIRA